jgi:predicted nucleotidyltransferase
MSDHAAVEPAADDFAAAQRDGEFLTVLGDAVGALEAAGIPHLLIGGVGASVMGRPRWTHDIDLFVTPMDVRRSRESLAAAGFTTEETDPTWLSKGWKRGVLVDLIFRSSGDVYLDQEMLERARVHDFGAFRTHVMPTEDLIVMKALTAKEELPHHWYDALALLASPDVDWDYLVRRARQHGLRRVCSLLLYAESNDIWVPERAICALVTALHDCDGGARG